MQAKPHKPAHSLITGNAYVLLAFASLFWSGNHIVGRAIAGHLPPLVVSTVRWLIPVILLGIFAQAHIRRDWPTIRAHRGIVLWLSVTGGALFTSLQYVGLKYTTALNVSILNSLVPVLIVGMATLIFRDSMALLQLAGIATSLLGVLVIITRGTLDDLLRLNFNFGDIIILFNMTVFAVYAVYLRLSPKLHWTSFLFVFGLVSTIGTAPFAVAEIVRHENLEINLLTIAATLYVSIFPSVFAFAAWNRGVELIGANRSGPFLHLIPLYTAILGSVLLDERLMLFHVIGLTLILSGIWLATRGKTPTKQTTPAES